MRIFISWIGNSDLISAHRREPDSDPGPILRLLRHQRFDELHLLNDIGPGLAEKGKATSEDYKDWLVAQVGLPSEKLALHSCDSNLKNNYGRAYEFTCKELRQIRSRHHQDTRFGLLLSPGYPAAQVAMILAAQTLFDPENVELFNTWEPKSSGAADWERIELSFSLSVDVGLEWLHRTWQRQHSAASPHPAFAAIKGNSRAIQTAKQLAVRVADFDSVSVLLRGESGTGKELFARGIHEASKRKGKPFVVLNCAAIPRELLESELFGHEKGAFTGATSTQPGMAKVANGGTLFLDEIGDMDSELQAKLLRFLQEKKYTPVGSTQEQSANVRVLAATHQDLSAAVASSRFRSDLYYRLDQVSIVLPSLRERGAEDIQLLARHALENFWKINGVADSNQKTLTDEACRYLTHFPWRGNVRELQNAIVRLAIFSPGSEITKDDVLSLVRPGQQFLHRPLRELSPAEFVTTLGAVFDELLARFNTSNGLPFQPGDEHNLFDDVLHPMVRGRALRAARDNFSQAGRLFQRAKMDDTEGKPDRKRLEYYRANLESWIDEDRIAQLRGSRE